MACLTRSETGLKPSEIVGKQLYPHRTHFLHQRHFKPNTVDSFFADKNVDMQRIMKVELASIFLVCLDLLDLNELLDHTSMSTSSMS